MPIKLREFYWRELLSAKDSEAKVYEKALTNSAANKSGKVSRR